MSHNVILEAFGEDCNLYTDVLKCAATVDAAGLRKAYYRAALRFHPDKNPGDTTAASKFQAVTAAYRILQDPDQRTAYDETGEFGGDDDDIGSSSSNKNPWRDYFDGIFGRVTTSGIDAFAQKYKCSDEERKDVLKAFTRCKGNLVSMLEVVLLSEPRDAPRWCQDYIQPAIDAGEIEDLSKAMKKSLAKCEKKIEQEKQEQEDDPDEKGVDTDATESEEDTPSPSKKRSSPAAKKPKPKNKKAKKNDDMTDLIAQIQSRRGGGAPNLAARYGVDASNNDDDPLADDAAFAKAQANLLKRR